MNRRKKDYAMILRTNSIEKIMENIRSLQPPEKNGPKFEISVTETVIKEMLAIIERLMLLYADHFVALCLIQIRDKLEDAYEEAFNKIAIETGKIEMPKNTEIRLPSSIIDNVKWLGEKFVATKAEEKDDKEIRL